MASSGLYFVLLAVIFYVFERSKRKDFIRLEESNQLSKNFKEVLDQEVNQPILLGNFNSFSIFETIY